MNVLDFYERKSKNQKISMITCYDYTSACIAAKSDVDTILVGDSLAMTMYGFDDTTQATVSMMVMHTLAVSRAAKNKFIIADMPFLSYRKSLGEAVDAAGALIQAGANAVKLEGASGNHDIISHLVESGVPVMGHLGLTPQYVNTLGGFKVQGRSDQSAKKIVEDALSLQSSGCFSIVLECIPGMLSKTITEKLSIPTIGIGAGCDTDGQVLVWQDMLGMNDTKFKFVKKYLNLAELINQSLNQYVADVCMKEFPQDENTYASE